MSAFAAFMSNMRCLTSLPIPVCAASLLLIEYVASTAAGHDVDNAMIRKEKSSLPLPFCCWRYRPTKAYFMYTVKVRREIRCSLWMVVLTLAQWSVLQYVILRPGEFEFESACAPAAPTLTYRLVCPVTAHAHQPCRSRASSASTTACSAPRARGASRPRTRTSA